jgi:hypothetical protein
MSGQYKVAWLREALLVSRSGYYDWKERRRQPGTRQLKNIRLPGTPPKVRIAQQLRRQTPMSRQWIADRLRMGSASYISNLLGSVDSEWAKCSRARSIY